MKRKDYQLADFPEYTEKITALLDSDPASASRTFNPLFTAILNNIKAVRLLQDQSAEGKTILSAAVREDGHLVLTMASGETIDCGNAEGPPGKTGADGRTPVFSIDSAGHLLVSYE